MFAIKKIRKERKEREIQNPNRTTTAIHNDKTARARRNGWKSVPTKEERITSQGLHTHMPHEKTTRLEDRENKPCHTIRREKLTKKGDADNI